MVSRNRIFGMDDKIGEFFKCFQITVRGVFHFLLRSCILKLKGVLNPNFQPFSFKLKKIRFFELNFDLGFSVL